MSNIISIILILRMLIDSILLWNFLAIEEYFIVDEELVIFSTLLFSTFVISLKVSEALKDTFYENMIAIVLGFLILIDLVKKNNQKLKVYLNIYSKFNNFFFELYVNKIKNFKLISKKISDLKLLLNKIYTVELSLLILILNKFINFYLPQVYKLNSNFKLILAFFYINRNNYSSLISKNFKNLSFKFFFKDLFFKKYSLSGNRNILAK